MPRAPLFEAIDLCHSAKKIVLKQLEHVIKEPTIKEDRPSCGVISVEKTELGSLIGRGGENIRSIEADTNTILNVVDNNIEMFSETRQGLLAATERIRSSTQKARVGEIYTDAKVAKVLQYGARVHLHNGKSGWLHVSEMDDGYVKDISDYVKEGDTITVKVIKVSDNGDIRVSMKSLHNGKGGGGSESGSSSRSGTFSRQRRGGGDTRGLKVYVQGRSSNKPKDITGRVG